MSIEKSRRAFLADCSKIIGSAAIASIVLPILQGCEPTSIPSVSEPTTDTIVDVSDLSVTKPVKQAPGLRGPDGKGILITRVSDTEYHVLSMECTHQQCNVETNAAGNSIPCFCHGSEFNLDGTVKKGPAEDPLRKYDAVFDAAKQQLRIMLT